MAITEADLHAYAARIRPHVPAELRDTAEEPAFAIATWAGARTKLLRPETSLDEIANWIATSAELSADSLDEVEAFMTLEEEIGFDLPDELAAQSSSTTFLDLVRYAQSRKRVI